VAAACPKLLGPFDHFNGIAVMTISLGTVLLVLLILLLLGALPRWPHSRGWGYAPSGVIGTILIIVLVLFLLGRL